MAAPLNATFFALQKRGARGVLLGAGIAFTVALLLLFLVFGFISFQLLGGEDFLAWYAEMMGAAMSGGGGGPPPNFAGVLALVPVQLLFVVGIFVLLSAFEASCVRWMLREERSAPFNLTFGADMWRVFGTYWAWLLYTIVGWLGFFAAIAVAGVAAATVDVVGALVGTLLCFGYLIGWFYVTIRLSPASATSIGVGEFAPLKTWRVTQGRFWPIFGAYLLLVLLNLLIGAIVGMVVLGALYGPVLTGVDWSTMTTDPEGFGRAYEKAVLDALEGMFSSPLMIALYVGVQLISHVVSVFFYILFYGVEARAVQAAIEEGKIEGAIARVA